MPKISPNPTDVLNKLREENPKATDAEIMRAFNELARYDSELMDGVLREVFDDLHRRHLAH
jgi:hypothetical protein